jgi:hypothetical protein
MIDDRSDRARALLATREMLLEIRDTHSDHGVRERAEFLIANIDALKIDPDNSEKFLDFARDYTDFRKRVSQLLK